MEAFNGVLLDGAVHPLDQTVGPGVVRLGEPVLDVVFLADHVEAHLARPGGVSVAGLFSKLDAVVCLDRKDLLRHGFDEKFEELPGCSSVRLFYRMGDRKLAGAVDGHEHVKLAFSGLNLGDIHVEEPDRIGLEALALGLVALDVR